MSPIRRVTFCFAILALGVAAQAGLEEINHTDRPDLLAPLERIPMRLGDWEGRDEPLDPEIRERAQTDDCLNRVYENNKYPGLKLALWINYSKTGLNLRHSPEICLPSNGWSKIESDSKVMPLKSPSSGSLNMTRLAYTRGEQTQHIGFLYYIFGEGALEHWVRGLRITSRSSHGRTTRGSGLTVEVFCPGANDPDSVALTDFAQALLVELEPRLPQSRAEYYIP